MFIINDEQKNLILQIGVSFIGKKLDSNSNCASFVKYVYQEAGLSTDFSHHPLLEYQDIYKDEHVGHLCFLKHKEDPRKRKKITHIGIIFPNKKILHYSKYIHGEGEYKVYLSSYEEVFEKYKYVDP